VRRTAKAVLKAMLGLDRLYGSHRFLACFDEVLVDVIARVGEGGQPYAAVGVQAYVAEPAW